MGKQSQPAHWTARAKPKRWWWAERGARRVRAPKWFPTMDQRVQRFGHAPGFPDQVTAGPAHVRARPPTNSRTQPASAERLGCTDSRVVAAAVGLLVRTKPRASTSRPAGSRTITKRTYTALLAEAPTMPNKRNSPDAVCARYAEKRTSLRLRMLDAETVLLQANEAGFRMLAELCASMASFSDPGFEMGPRSAGSRLFAKTSAFGIYLHRVEPKVAARSPQQRAPRPRTAKQGSRR